MVTIEEIPDTMNFGISRRLLLDLGLPVPPLINKTKPGMAMSREDWLLAQKRIPLADVRRMLAERR